jgi:hypothetical protein
MYADFKEMPSDARIWIYQANRTLHQEEQAQILEAIQVFLESWTAHQQALKASATILHNRFVVIAVDENLHQASGCSIDKQVHCIQSLEKQFAIKLLDRSEIALMVEGEIITVPLSKIPEYVQNQIIKKDTILFNNAITELQALQTQWLQKAADTWMKRYFKDVVPA